MKKKIITLLVTSAACLITACNDVYKLADGYITVDFKSISELGSDFDSNYYPDKTKVKQRSGIIDVCLDFENTAEGWEAVANEYCRIHNNQVKINVRKELGGSTYQTTLTSQLQNSKTDWDIVQGNLAGIYANDSYMMNVGSYSTDKNYYCGSDVTWGNVLDDCAFTNVESGRTDQVYMINSENMQTCWFVNDVSFNQAKEAGWKNKSNNEGYPETWDDLMSLCEKLVSLGYTNPLGITLCDASIRSSQFSWLLRVYGDYYYRQFYRYTANTKQVWAEYDETIANIESQPGFAQLGGPIANMMLDTETTYSTDYSLFPGLGYIGVKSDIYGDFLNNLCKIKPYLIKNVDQLEFNSLRDQFRSQNQGKASAQIMLDYLGNGLSYTTKETESFKCGYFDYPTMESTYVKDTTITRDIGGNGGFLSLVKHIGDVEQNALNKDFLMFFLSPYGQTFYYQGLASSEKGAPTGESTVKVNFPMPEKWKNFFADAETKITFNGNVDGNKFLSWGVRYFKSMENSESVIKSLWQGLLIDNIGSGSYDQESFCYAWDEAIMADYQILESENGWPQNAYKNPDSGISA